MSGNFIVGNDISAAQGSVNFDHYKSNSNFVICKATEGVGFKDPQFINNQSEARRVGLPVGYYHFARPDLGNSAQAEAEYFLNTIGELRVGEVLALDFEVGFNNPVGWCKDFLDHCVALCGVHPLIYLNKSQVSGNDWTPVAEAGYGLWLACYDDNVITGAWKLVAIQQWTNQQTVPGIIGNVDGDYFFGTAEQFKMYGYEKPIVSSPSPSISPSSSQSVSVSPSSSPSNSLSASSSVSASPSPTSPNLDDLYYQLVMVIHSQWNWFGVNGWYKKLKQLRKIIGG